jgi:hypothetical protein
MTEINTGSEISQVKPFTAKDRSRAKIGANLHNQMKDLFGEPPEESNKVIEEKSEDNKKREEEIKRNVVGQKANIEGVFGGSYQENLKVGNYDYGASQNKNKVTESKPEPKENLKLELVNKETKPVLEEKEETVIINEPESLVVNFNGNNVVDKPEPKENLKLEEKKEVTVIEESREPALMKFGHLLEKLKQKIDFYGFTGYIGNFLNRGKVVVQEKVEEDKPSYNVSVMSEKEMQSEASLPKNRIFKAYSDYKKSTDFGRLDTFLGSVSKIVEENKLEDEELNKYLSLAGISRSMFNGLVRIAEDDSTVSGDNVVSFNKYKDEKKKENEEAA